MVGQLLRHTVHLAFTTGGQLRRMQFVGIHLIGRRGHMAHHNHQFSLHFVQQQLPAVVGRQQRTYDAYHCVQLVQTAIGFNTDVILRHPLSSVNAGRSLVAGLCIDSFHTLSANNLFKSVSPQYRWV